MAIGPRIDSRKSINRKGSIAKTAVTVPPPSGPRLPAGSSDSRLPAGTSFVRPRTERQSQSVAIRFRREIFVMSIDLMIKHRVTNEGKSEDAC
jgi:hypothetical protein